MQYEPYVNKVWMSKLYTEHMKICVNYVPEDDVIVDADNVSTAIGAIGALIIIIQERMKDYVK